MSWKFPFLRENQPRLITPKPKVDFNALVALCVHRAVDPQAWENLQIISHCPNPRMIVRIKQGDALIDRARSSVATRFLENKDYDVLIFLDDDIVLHDPRDIIKLARLVNDQGCDIVGASYMLKTQNNPHFAIKTFDGDNVAFGKSGACVEVEMVSTGCMAISRRVLEKMAETMPLCHPENHRFYPFFQPFPKQRENGEWIYLSEDWAFCSRARDLGFKIFCDTTTKLGHAGRYVYEWDEMLKPAIPEVTDFTYLDNGKQIKVERTDLSDTTTKCVEAA